LFVVHCPLSVASFSNLLNHRALTVNSRSLIRCTCTDFCC
jgi:hypothetical protein